MTMLAKLVIFTASCYIYTAAVVNRKIYLAGDQLQALHTER